METTSKISRRTRKEVLSVKRQFAEQERQLPPYTMEEIHAMISQSEHDLAEGRYRDIDDLFSEWDEGILGCETRTKKSCQRGFITTLGKLAIL